MSQRKKEDVRTAILDAAFRLFSEQGYIDTSIPAIAREAGISTANVYVYFGSKLEVLYTLYEPWLTERLEKLERSLKRIASPEARLERLLTALWRDLPRETNGFAKNIMQALSTSSVSDSYSPHLRELFQGRVAQWIGECLDVPPAQGSIIAGVVLMAFDGFAMNVHLDHGMACDAKTARLFSRMLSGSRAGGDAPAAAA
ncbi:TetR/AcrR family transcriptional regulator [Variovorax sp. KK3]|uniref:TetR/AcrR family transcriptional regulator n=1 Tax=Variovorax sp. KK3 TaxID=1855728 RepID=UPI00097BDC9A|nr:TetR/AcrR family transcriptional regulator [Variovorax sp. KK3]